jgi:hypothetical protein
MVASLDRDKGHNPRTFHGNLDKLGLFTRIPTGQTKTLGFMEQEAAFLIAALVASRAQGAETMTPQYLTFDLNPPVRRSRRSRFIGIQGWLALAGLSILAGAVLAFTV